MTQVSGYADRMFGSPSKPEVRQQGTSKVSDIALPSNLRRRSCSPTSSGQPEKAASPAKRELGIGRESTCDDSKFLGSRRRRSDAACTSSSVGQILSTPRPHLSQTPNAKSRNSPGFESRQIRSSSALQRGPFRSPLAMENSPNPHASRGQLRQPGDVDAHPGTIRCFRDSQHNVTCTALRTGSPGLPWEGQQGLVGVDGSKCGHKRLAGRAHGGPSGDLGPGGEKNEKNSDSRWALPGPSPTSPMTSPKTRRAASPAASPARNPIASPAASPARTVPRLGEQSPVVTPRTLNFRCMSNCSSGPCTGLPASEYPARPSDIQRTASLANLDKSDWANHFQRRQNASSMSSGLGNTPRVSCSGRVSSPPAWRM